MATNKEDANQPVYHSAGTQAHLHRLIRTFFIKPNHRFLIPHATLKGKISQVCLTQHPLYQCLVGTLPPASKPAGFDLPPGSC